MEWQIVVALILAIPVILIPVREGSQRKTSCSREEYSFTLIRQ